MLLETAYDFSIGMSIVDFFPVIFFSLATVVLLRFFYDKMSKGAFALYSAGMISVIVAGFLKGVWKLLYACNVCDFERLNAMFFPLQSVGFILAGIAMIGLLFFPQEEKTTKTLSVPPVFAGTMLFVGFNIAGCLACSMGYVAYARKQKKTGLMILFIVQFVLNLAMGYLSTKNFEQAYMNWIAEAVNTLAQGLLLVGALKLSKANPS